jgi:hypothetical protein
MLMRAHRSHLAKPGGLIVSGLVEIITVDGANRKGGQHASAKSKNVKFGDQMHTSPPPGDVGLHTLVAEFGKCQSGRLPRWLATGTWIARAKSRAHGSPLNSSLPLTPRLSQGLSPRASRRDAGTEWSWRKRSSKLKRPQNPPGLATNDVRLGSPCGTPGASKSGLLCPAKRTSTRAVAAQSPP